MTEEELEATGVFRIDTNSAEAVLWTPKLQSLRKEL